MDDGYKFCPHEKVSREYNSIKYISISKSITRMETAKQQLIICISISKSIMRKGSKAITYEIFSFSKSIQIEKHQGNNLQNSFPSFSKSIQTMDPAIFLMDTSPLSRARARRRSCLSPQRLGSNRTGSPISVSPNYPQTSKVSLCVCVCMLSGKGEGDGVATGEC